MFLPCRPCLTAEECDLPPTSFCVWGENRDYCKRRVCSKVFTEIKIKLKRFLGYTQGNRLLLIKVFIKVS